MSFVEIGIFNDCRFVYQVEQRRVGQAAEPWTTWHALCDLERAVGDANAAAVARHKAVEVFLAYHRTGGENQNPSAQLYTATARAIAEGKTDQLRAEVCKHLKHPDLPPPARVLIPTLRAILDGSRNTALTDDNPDRYYTDAVEVRLLLQTVAGQA